MKRIIKILMQRDGMDYEDAKDLLEETKELILDSIDDMNIDDVDQIIAEQLGLEPDYLFDIIS